MYNEFNELLERALKGEDEAVSKLIEALRPLIVSSIKRYCPIAAEFEDLLQDGAVMVLHCLESYDAGRNVRFLHYVKSSLRFYYLESYRYVTGRSATSLNVCDEEGNSFLDLIVDDFSIEEDYETKFDNGQLYSAVRALPARQKEVVLLYYFYSMGMSEIASFLNISYRSVVNSKAKAINNLRRFYCDFGQKVN